MKIKRLDIHGFKSFAAPTRLEFDDGVAGIVGPNGSGKSNLVEAIRWALGEQSLSQLRGRRTEDVVWAGAARRAPAGMAEVSVTFDNSDRLLPIPYAEVTVTRRAYRSGENEYLINRNRVRLRDVNELTAHVGGGYTVVSQGTADAALSLSPEGRRGLFEEAADITQHHARRDDALRKLAETRANRERVADLQAELAPRMRALARQARQAREREAEEARLRDLLLALLARDMARSEAALAGAEREAAEAERRAAELGARADRAEARERSLRETETEREARLSDLAGRRSALRGEADAAAHAALDAERRLLGLERELATAEGKLHAARAVREAAEAEAGEALGALASAREQLKLAERQLRDLEQAAESRLRLGDTTGHDLDRLRLEAGEHERRAASARGRALALAARIEAADEEIGRHEESLRAAERAVREAAGRAAETARALAAARAHAQECAASHESAQTRLRAAERGVSAAAAHLSGREGALRERRARLDVLRETSAVGGGFNRAVQAVLRAGEDGRLGGIVGALGSLLQAPPRLEAAVEAALGGALGSVVVREWRHAEEAIALLRRAGAGRVTFLPLDTLRPPSRPRAPEGEGIVGLAADLVRFPEEVRAAALHALGRALVVEDLQAARRLAGAMRGLGLVVTLGGETLRPGGALTGGSAPRESGVLGRHRELREAPALLRALEAERDAAAGELRATREAREAAAGEARASQASLAHADRAARAAEGAHAGAVSARERALHAEEWARDALGRAQRERDQLRAALDEAGRVADEAETDARGCEARLRAAREAIGDRERDAREAEARRSALRSELALAGERLRAASTRHERAQARLRGAADTLTAHEGAADALRRRAASESDAVEAAREVQRVAEGRLGALHAELEPLETALRRARREREEARAEALRLRGELHALEGRRLAAALEAQRRKDGHAALLARAREELGGELPPGGVEPPPDVERQVTQCRDRLARIGPVNPLAAREHAELEARASFLDAQIADLEAAERDLRELVETLGERMERRFSETFRLVSELFGSHFERLFGGGTARLALVSRGDSVGVEMEAQPPGKRLGSLSLLSGGERALSSCALLFALIRASGAPYCVLDEVDAALDESNVGRFCDLLHELARDTQFIVVTHNRGTIERAGRLYGVSMDGGGVSQVLSLRLEGEERRPATATA